MMKILAIIPARSGSKSIPHKNIRSIAGKPLLAHSIEHAIKSELINRVIVSTDSEQYAELARSFGAETPFLRPEEISGDKSNDRDYFIHALKWFKDNEDYVPDICVQLRPTHPVRKIEDIDAMIRLLISNPDADSVRSVVKNDTYTPYKMWLLDNNNELKPLMTNTGIHEHYNQPRQELPVTYFQNASVDVIRTSTITEKNSLSGDKILGYVMDAEYDIDNELEFVRAEQKLLEITGKLNNEPKTYCFDIDGVIASLTPGNDYHKATPLLQNISKINQLYDNGNKIILFTARGTVTKIDWTDLTVEQMKDWGVKYHVLQFGKPAADFYVDDRNLDINRI